MAIAFEGFSIREYASKMRSVDVMKGWPFGVGCKEETQRQEMESLLPPITCRKYRWWSKELEMMKSNVGERNELVSSDKISGFGSEEHAIEKPEASLKEKVLPGAEEERLVMICPVCGSFSASTVNAVNAHIDSCLAQASREERRQMRKAAAAAKAKTRPAKKRSIVEIFAVAPQIENMEIDCDEENCEGIEDLPENRLERQASEALGAVLSKEKKKNGKSKEEALAILRKLKLKIKKKKRRKKKKNNKMSTTEKIIHSSLKREKSHKGPSAFDYSAKLKSSLSNKRLEKKNSDTLPIQKRKVSRKKNVSMENQLKVIRASKLCTTHYQEEPPVYPLHSILKNQKRVIPSQKSSTVENIQGDQTISDNVQQLSRHVRFSGKDDIIGPRTEHSSSIALTKSKGICQVISDVTDASSASGFPEKVNNSLPAVETLKVNGSGEDLSRSVINGIRIHSANETAQLDDFHGQVAVLPFASSNCRSLHDNERDLLDESLDLTQPFQYHENFSQFNRDRLASLQRPYVGLTRLLNIKRKDWGNPNVEPNANGNVERVTNRGQSGPAHLVVPITRTAVSDSLSNINATSQPAASHLSVNTDENRRLPLPSQAAMQNSNGCGMQYQQFYHMSTKGLMTSIVDWKKEKATLSREDGIYDDFIGLPLNSQGELIQLHSSEKGNISQLKKQNTVNGSACSFSVQNFWPRSSMDPSNIIERHYIEKGIPKDKLPSFSEDFLQDNPRRVLSSERGTTLQGTGRTDCWQDSLRGNTLPIRQLGLDSNLMNISACGCGKINQIPNETENEKTPRGKTSETCMTPCTVPTMRLMGKDVAVGRANTGDGFEDGKIWTDKEIVTEHCPTMIYDNSLAGRHFREELIVNPVMGKAKETVLHSFEPRGNPISPSFSQMKYVDNSFAHSYLGWHAMPQNGPLLTSGNRSMYTHSPPSQGLMSRTLKFPGPCVPQAESRISSHLSLSSSAHNPCQPLLMNSAQLGNNQTLVRATSAFKFPFAGQDCREYVQPPRPKCSPQSLPQWMINSTQQKENSLGSPSSCSDININQYPCSMSGADLFPAPSHCTAVISHHPSNNTANFPRVQTTFGTSASAHRPLIPVLPGFKPTSSISTSYRNRIKAKDKPKSKLFHLSDAVGAKKDKKRPADKSDASTECAKKPNLEMQVESSSMTGLSQSRSNCHMLLQNAELDANCDKGRFVEYSQIESQKVGCRTSPGFIVSHMDNMTRSGPIKLSAGARHILKPCQKSDHDNSRPIHSTIPFGAVSNSCKVTGIEKKSAKIYRF